MKLIWLTFLFVIVISTAGCASSLKKACDNYAETVVLLSEDNFLGSGLLSEDLIIIKSDISDLTLELIEKQDNQTRIDFELFFSGIETEKMLSSFTDAKKSNDFLEMQRIGMDWKKSLQDLNLKKLFYRNNDEFILISFRAISRLNHRRFEDKYGKKSFSEAEKLYKDYLLSNQIASGVPLNRAKIEAEAITLNIPDDLDIRNEWIRLRFIPQRKNLVERYIKFLKLNNSKEAEDALLKINEFDNKEAPLLQQYQKIRKKKLQRELMNR